MCAAEFAEDDEIFGNSPCLARGARWGAGATVAGDSAGLAALPALAIRPSDFARWQRTVLDGSPALDALLAYWTERLASLPPLELPTDRP